MSGFGPYRNVCSWRLSLIRRGRSFAVRYTAAIRSAPERRGSPRIAAPISRRGVAAASPTRSAAPSGQVLQLQRLRLASVEDCLDVGRQQGQAEQAVDEATGEAFGLAELVRCAEQ